MLSLSVITITIINTVPIQNVVTVIIRSQRSSMLLHLVVVAIHAPKEIRKYVSSILCMQNKKEKKNKKQKVKHSINDMTANNHA